MEARLPTAQEAAIGFARRLRPQDLAEIVDFDSRVEILQPFTNDVDELEQAHPQDVGGRIDLDVQRGLHRAEGTQAGRRHQRDEIRRQAIVVLSDGEDTSSLLPFEEVLDLAKRSETAIYAIGLRRPRPRLDSKRGFKEAEFVLRQLSQETGGRAFFPANVGELAAIYDQIADELSSQYTVGYTSRNTRRDGAWRRVVVRVNRPNLVTQNQAGLFRPDVAVGGPALANLNLIPLALYVAALVAYVWHFARRQPAVGRTATTLLVAGALAHTFVIGMQTMEVGHVPFAGTTSAISTFVWLLGARVSVHRDDDRRARHGGVHPAAARRAPDDPGVQARRRGAVRPAARMALSASTCRRCSSPTPASPWRASSASPTCCCSRKSRQSTSGSSTHGCRRCRCSTR